MKTRYLVCAALCLLTTGCGTVNTVVRGDEVARKNLVRVETHCNSIPRVYSGVSYDFCLFYAAPPPEHSWRMNATPDVFIDFIFSGVLDTVALPYTLYRQYDDGNIQIQRP